MMRLFKQTVPFVKHEAVPAGKPWHGKINHHLFSITVGGGSDYSFPQGHCSVGQGDLLYFEPGTPQVWTAHPEEGWDVLYLITDIPNRLVGLLPSSDLAPGVGRLHLEGTVFQEVRDAFCRLDAWWDMPSMLTKQLFLNHLECILLLIRGIQPTTALDPRIEKARTFLHANVVSPTSLAEVAHAACLSKSRLSALFKEALGASPLHYLEQLRMERAAQLLVFTSLDITQIAESLCYSERKYFDKRFKRHWQVTPYRYRREALGARR